MGKRTTTIMTAVETTDAPANIMFEIYGDHAFANLKIFALEGTAPTITMQIEERRIDGPGLEYVSQTANFTPGRTIRGQVSGATGLIMKDTDGGSTGEIELVNVNGFFIDGEPIQETAIVTPGKAVAQLPLTVGGPFGTGGRSWGSTGAVTKDAALIVMNPDLADFGDSGEMIVIPRRFRVRISKGGTWTKAVFSVQLVQSGGDL